MQSRQGIKNLQSGLLQTFILHAADQFPYTIFKTTAMGNILIITITKMVSYQGS